MNHVLRRPGLPLLAALCLFAGPLGASPQKTPPPPPASPAPPPSPRAPEPPAAHVHGADLDLDVDVDVDEEPGHGPAIVRVHSSQRSFLGVRLTELTPELREHFGAPRDAGVMIASVEADGPAAKAGLKVGDVVTRAGETPVSLASDLSRAVGRKEEGEKLALGIVRNGKPASVEVMVAARKRSSREVRISGPGAHAWGFGFPGFDQERFDRQMDRLREKLAALEVKMRELEKRFATK